MPHFLEDLSYIATPKNDATKLKFACMLFAFYFSGSCHNPFHGWFLMMFGDGSPLGIQPPAENDLMNCMHGQEHVLQDLSYRSHVHHCLSTYHLPSIWLVAPCFLFVVSWFYFMLNTVPTTLNILACYESRLGHPESLCFPTFGSAVLTIFCTTTPTMPSKN
jgi:hypothetical protein